MRPPLHFHPVNNFTHPVNNFIRERVYASPWNAVAYRWNIYVDSPIALRMLRKTPVQIRAQIGTVLRTGLMREMRR